jgi:hypothetical protein
MEVPIVPILLLPFILIFFVIVFPIWGAALIVIGTLLLVVRGVNFLLTKMGSTVLQPVDHAMFIALRWVWTFGGFAGKITGGAQQAQQPQQQHRP